MTINASSILCEIQPSFDQEVYKSLLALILFPTHMFGQKNEDLILGITNG